MNSGKFINAMLRDIQGTAYSKVKEIVNRPEGGSFDEIAQYIYTAEMARRAVARLEVKLERILDKMS